jgi:potassium voltage-gated channel Shal-related subfamily D protein 2
MVSVAAWLPFVRAAAIGWLPLGHRAVPSLPACIAAARAAAGVGEGASSRGGPGPADNKVLINVSGQLFETCCNTLSKYPDTLLGSNEKVSYIYAARALA